MKSCTLCSQRFVGEAELEMHLVVVHGLSEQASSAGSSLKRKLLSQEGVVSKNGYIFLSFHRYILN